MIIKKVLLGFVCLYISFNFNHDNFVLGNEITTPQIEAPAAVLMDANTGIIIYDKNMNEAKYPASLTKLMTALMLLEHVDGDFSQSITMSRNAVFSIPRGSSHIAMDEDETLTAEESLYAIMLESANEVSNAIGEHIGQDLDTFAEMMTNRAFELGAVNTSFTNAHGLHHENNYTTAYDMALIMQELITHDKFLQVISTRMYTIPPTEKQVLERILNNSHRMIHLGGPYYNEYTVGGKTGFTNEASHTLATYAEKDDMRLIAVVLDNQQLVSYTDTAILFDYGFNVFDDIEIFNNSNFRSYVDVIQNNDSEIIELGRVPVVAENSIIQYLPLTVDTENIHYETDLPHYISAPVEKGDVVGQLTLKYQNIVLDTVNLIADENIEYVPVVINTTNNLPLDGGFLSFMPVITGIVLFVFLMFLILKIKKLRRRRKYRRSSYNQRLRYSRYRYK